jgi:hypothetical protein
MHSIYDPDCESDLGTDRQYLRALAAALLAAAWSPDARVVRFGLALARYQGQADCERDLSAGRRFLVTLAETLLEAAWSPDSRVVRFGVALAQYQGYSR